MKAILFKFLYKYLVILQLPLGIKFQSIKPLLVLIILIGASFILKTNLIYNEFFYNFRKVIIILAVFYSIYLFINLIVRIYNIFLKTSLFFIRKHSSRKQLAFGFYTLGFIYLTFNIVLLLSIYNGLILYDETLFQYLSLFIFYSLIIAILYIDYISDEAIKINRNTLITNKYSLSYFFLIINILLLNLSLFNLVNIMYTEYLSNLSLEINKSWFLNPDDNNSENKKDVKIFHNGKETLFKFNFQLNNYFKETGVPYNSDINCYQSKIYKKYFVDTLQKIYFDKSITKEQWMNLYDVQFKIFEKLNPKFDIITRLRLMHIYTKDLQWNNYLPLNKLVLRQIAELKRIEEIEIGTKAPIDMERPIYKYLNYIGGVPNPTS